MEKSFKHPVLMFVVFTFLLFWILFGITGAVVFSDGPVFLQTVMKNICAWSSTVVLLVFFRKIIPGTTRKEFIKNQFNRVRFTDFLVPTLIQLAITAAAVTAVLSVSGISLKEAEFVSASRIIPLVLINITSGPLGEELGWRGFLVWEFRKKFNFLVTAVSTGLIWGLWHFPLWIVSGFTGTDLLFYSGSFMLGIISFSVFITWFYARTKNIIVAVWIHFLFNFLMQVVILEEIKYIFFVSVIYFIVSAVIVFVKRPWFFSREKT